MQQAHISPYDLKILQLLSKTHNRLSQKFPFVQESRQLTIQENQLLFQIGNESPHYKILVAAMAVDTYTQSISEIFDEADSLLEILSICLSCAQKMKHEMKKIQTTSQAQIAFQNLYNSLITIIDSASNFNPNSPYLQIYRSVLSDECENLSQNIYSSLKQQNKQLKQRLRLNDEKIIELQIKLTRILQQHQGEAGGIQATMKNYELKQEIERKQRQIQKMNEQFCYEIEKYNVVYETLKRELQEYKSYQNNVQTVKLIEKLQTEIIVLREQKQREQMINEELRHRLQIVSQANLGPIHSPRMAQKRRDVSRTQYVNDQYGQPFDQYYYERDSLQYDTEIDESDPQIRVSTESIYKPMINRGYAEYINHSNQYRY